jgi:hypothetical protein
MAGGHLKPDEVFKTFWNFCNVLMILDEDVMVIPWFLECLLQIDSTDGHRKLPCRESVLRTNIRLLSQPVLYSIEPLQFYKLICGFTSRKGVFLSLTRTYYTKQMTDYVQLLFPRRMISTSIVVGATKDWFCRPWTVDSLPVTLLVSCDPNTGNCNLEQVPVRVWPRHL